MSIAVPAAFLAFGCSKILGFEEGTPRASGTGGSAGSATAGANFGGSSAGRGGSAGSKASGGTVGSGASANGGKGGQSGESGNGGAAGGGEAGSAGNESGGAGSSLSGGGTSGSDGGSGPIVSPLGPCDDEGALACEDHAQQNRLVCDEGRWQSYQPCTGGFNCDTRGGALAGKCAPVIGECAGRPPGEPFCSGMSVITCGADLVTSDSAACAAQMQRCTGGACHDCLVGTANCDDEQKDCETKLDSMGSCGTGCGDLHTCTPGTQACQGGHCATCGGTSANCDAKADDCETQLDAPGTCGKSCATAKTCDALSAPTCVNAGCSGLWAGWAMPNDASDIAAGAPNPVSYVANGDGTVADQVTGLVWEQVPPSDPLVLADAIAHCTGLTLGGHDDWRIPSFIELVSLVDYGRGIPSINVTYFPQTPDGVYWTTSPVSGQADTLFTISFHAGDLTTTWSGITVGIQVRCVRGGD